MLNFQKYLRRCLLDSSCRRGSHFVLEQQTSGTALGNQINDFTGSGTLSFGSNHFGNSVAADGIFEETGHTDIAGAAGDQRDPQQIKAVSRGTDVSNRGSFGGQINTIEVTLSRSLQRRATSEKHCRECGKTDQHDLFEHFSLLRFKFISPESQTGTISILYYNSIAMSILKYFFLQNNYLSQTFL
jgi:hypothetical protein